MCIPTLVVVGLAVVANAPVGALPGNLAFSMPQQLARWAGGEPSLAFDPRGNGSVYVVAPQSIPSAVNGVFGFPAGSNGVGFWASTDHGRTFPLNANIASTTGGGDSDVEVGADGTVYVADLEAVATDICTSSDGGKSFTAGVVFTDCGPIVTNQQGPDNDRQWLNRGLNGDLLLTYHDFAAGFPIILKSTDKAQTFLPCGAILDPTGPAGQNYQPLNGTLVAKPAIGKDGTVYVEVTEPDVVAPPVGAALNHLFMTVAEGGCSPTTVFKNYPIYTDPGAELGKIFNAMAIDGGGTLYVVAGGKTKAGQTDTNIWLFTSHDGGKTWSAPTQVNTPDLKANVMPAVVGGLGNDQVALGWFGTASSGDPNGLKNQWRYYAATSTDGGKTFQQTAVTPGVIHYGDICTQGLFCGLVPGQPSNRNLADFSSIAVDPADGCLVVALPGDPSNRPDIAGDNNFSSSTYVSYQTAGPCLAAPAAAATGNGAGGSPAGAATGATRTTAATGLPAAVLPTALGMLLLGLALRRRGRASGRTR